MSISTASVIIPAYNKATELLFCLKSLERQSIPKYLYEVIVVDDGSTDTTSEIVDGFKACCNVHQIKINSGPSGCARARNIGLESASGRIAVFLDADIVVSQDYIESHLNAHEAMSRVVNLGYIHAVGISDKTWYNCAQIASLFALPFHIIDKFDLLRRAIQFLLLRRHRKNHGWTILNWPRSDITHWNFSDSPRLLLQASSQEIFPDFRERWSREHGGLMNLPAPWTCCWGGNVSLERSFLQEVGKFDEEFREYGAEDLELGFRLWKAGGYFCFDSQARGLHYPHPRNATSDKKSEITNSSYFLQKHPVFEVEMNAIYGCHEVNNRLRKIRTLSQRGLPSIELALRDVRVWNFLREDCFNPCLVIGCGDGVVLQTIGADVGLELDSDQQCLATQSFPNKAIHRLLGIATPFERKSFETVLVIEIWRYLSEEMLGLLIREGLRIGNRLLLLILPGDTFPPSNWGLSRRIKRLGNSAKVRVIYSRNNNEEPDGCQVIEVYRSTDRKDI